MRSLYKYDIEVRDSRSLAPYDQDGVITSGCHVIVYNAGTKTKSTIYADESKTAKTNDITRSAFATDTKISFWSASSSHDIFVADDKGNNNLFVGVTPNRHVVALDRAQPIKCLFFPMVFNSGGTETDTGLDLPKQSFVYDAAVEVVTTDATETVDIGTLTGETNADPNGFIAAASVANSGFVQPVTVTVGSNETYIAATTLGTLLATLSAGSDVATDVGAIVRKMHFVTGSDAVSVSYTPSSSDTFAGYGYVWYTAAR